MLYGNMIKHTIVTGSSCSYEMAKPVRAISLGTTSFMLFFSMVNGRRPVK